MAVSAGFRTFVLEQLAGTVRARGMFGGVGLYLEAAFFGLIDDDTLYFKVDDTTRAEYQGLGSRPFDPFKDGRVMRGYYEVPGEVLEDRERLREWQGRAVQVARRSKAGKGKSRG